MDVRIRRSARAWLMLVPLACLGCANAPWWPIRPFGSVHTYDGTIFRSAGDRPRGRMVGPPAPGFSIAADPGSHDSETRPASAN
jgi:hypothetical protein